MPSASPLRARPTPRHRGGPDRCHSARLLGGGGDDTLDGGGGTDFCLAASGTVVRREL
ncbi:MAG TPA: hypothetical protein VGQ83_39865 [Polyangia bacterium]